MKKIINKVNLFINKQGTLLVSVFLMVLSPLFFVTSYFGMNNSSICSFENKCQKIKEDNGSYIHIRHYLSDETEGRKKSVISPVNSFNSYMINEVGRYTSFVLDKEFSITFDEGTGLSGQILYSDYYSKNLTTNRIALNKGEYNAEEFADKNTIYVSKPIIDSITGLDPTAVIDKKVTLSLADGREFTVKGIADVGSINNTGIQFKHLFSDKFIVINSMNVYDFGFSDLMFESEDYYFVDDLVKFRSEFNKSYLDYSKVSLKISSRKAGAIETTDVFKLGKLNNASNITISVVTILAMLIIAFSYCYVVFVYDFNSKILIDKIICCVLSIGLSFVPMIIGLVLMIKGAFITRVVISLLIAFAAIITFEVVMKFSFFKPREEKAIEGENNDKQ